MEMNNSKPLSFKMKTIRLRFWSRAHLETAGIFSEQIRSLLSPALSSTRGGEGVIGLAEFEIELR
jgi:hypothetical protein